MALLEFICYTAFMLTPEHSRAARGWLNWTQDDLAKRANVSLSTIRDFEKGRRVPIANNLDAIRRVFEANGIKMLDDNGRAAGIAIPILTNLEVTAREPEKIHGDDGHA